MGKLQLLFSYLNYLILKSEKEFRKIEQDLTGI